MVSKGGIVEYRVDMHGCQRMTWCGITNVWTPSRCRIRPPMLCKIYRNATKCNLINWDEII